MVVEVLHPSRPNVPKAELEAKLAGIYKTDKERVTTFGFRTQFGGGRSTGFALIYDDLESQKKFEPRYRLVRVRRQFSFLLLLSVLTFVTFAFSLVLLQRWTRHPVSSERRGKTVQRRCVSSVFIDQPAFLHPISSAPRYQKVQGCRSPEEEVICSPLFFSLTFGCPVLVQGLCVRTLLKNCSCRSVITTRFFFYTCCLYAPCTHLRHSNCTIIYTSARVLQMNK